MPASAAEPSGHSFSRAPAVGEPAAVARQHLDIGEQMVAERDGLRRLQMGEARHRVGGVLAARSASARITSASCASSPSIASRTQRRKSVATWSLRLRAVCSRLPASPMRSVSRASMFMWMSSSAVVKGKRPASISCGDGVQAVPDRLLVGRVEHARSCASMAAWAREPRMSCRHSLRSKPIEALMACMTADGPAAKRPPHCMLASACAAFGVSVNEGVPRWS